MVKRRESVSRRMAAIRVHLPKKQMQLAKDCHGGMGWAPVSHVLVESGTTDRPAFVQVLLSSSALKNLPTLPLMANP